MVVLRTCICCLTVFAQNAWSVAVDHTSGRLRGPGRAEDVEPLTDEDLGSIVSIDCLHERRDNPDAPCDGKRSSRRTVARQQLSSADSEAPLNTGNFPSWRDERCRSNGEFFCDPGGILDDASRYNVTRSLRTFWNNVRVTCGQLDAQMSGVETSDNRHFNLGAIVLGESWPSTETDPETLQKFGRHVMSDWGLMPIYNGVDSGQSASDVFTRKQYLTNCPDSALLIILPKHREVYLSTPSCEFLCESRGGPEVMDAMLSTMDEDGLAAAIQLGVAQVARILKETSPLSLESSLPSYYKKESVPAAYDIQHELASNDVVWNVVQRCVLVIVIGLTAVGVIGLTMSCLAPRSEDRDAPLREFRLPPKIPM